MSDALAYLVLWTFVGFLLFFFGLWVPLTDELTRESARRDHEKACREAEERNRYYNTPEGAEELRRSNEEAARWFAEDRDGGRQ